MQLPLWTPDSSWTPTPISQLPSWSGAKRIGLDCETKDPHLRQLGPGVRRGGYVVGVGFAIEDGPRHYLPIRHAGGDNVDEALALRYLQDNMSLFEGDYVGANISYDLDFLLQEGLKFNPNAKFRDIQVADPLIYELQEEGYSLAAIARRYGLPGKDETLLEEAAKAYGVDPKGGLWQLPARFVGAYGEADAALPLMILRRQERLIDERDLWDIWNLETEVLPVLVRMRRRGVRIDERKLEEIEEWSLREEAEALRLVRHETGVQIAVGDVWKPEGLARALEQIGVRLTKTKQGKPSIDKDLLAGIDHPVAEALGWARKTNKLRTTFASGMRKYAIGDRIHCTFNQIAREAEDGSRKGTISGRLSAVDPNLQNQPNPKKDAKIAGEWRKIFLPEEGQLWASCDYSQQEPRWITHFAAVMDLPGAREAAQAYHDDPNIDNHQFMADLTGLPRAHAKNLYLGIGYGEGGGKLCDELGLPTRWALSVGRGKQILYFATQQEAFDARSKNGGGWIWRAAGEEGQKILDAFDERAPFVRMLAKAAGKRAEQKGYVITGGGRRLHFPQRQDGGYEFTHKGLNRVIQGTSADQMKKALVVIDAEGIHLMLQVHDEANGSVADERETNLMAEIMQDIMPAEVPFRVDADTGPSWGDAIE